MERAGRLSVLETTKLWVAIEPPYGGGTNIALGVKWEHTLDVIAVHRTTPWCHIT